jgi:hypothetical protein
MSDTNTVHHNFENDEDLPGSSNENPIIEVSDSESDIEIVLPKPLYDDADSIDLTLSQTSTQSSSHDAKNQDSDEHCTKTSMLVFEVPVLDDSSLPSLPTLPALCAQMSLWPVPIPYNQNIHIGVPRYIQDRIRRMLMETDSARPQIPVIYKKR